MRWWWLLTIKSSDGCWTNLGSHAHAHQSIKMVNDQSVTDSLVPRPHFLIWFWLMGNNKILSLPAFFFSPPLWERFSTVQCCQYDTVKPAGLWERLVSNLWPLSQPPQRPWAIKWRVDHAPRHVAERIFLNVKKSLKKMEPSYDFNLV